MTLKIKICGLTNAKDAHEAVDSGASYLGVIFAETSPRRVDLENAKLISAKKPDGIYLVGVFQNQPLALVNSIADQIDLDYVQLHGEESVEYCRAVERPVIKVINLKSSADAPNQDLTAVSTQYSRCSEYLMFDKSKGDTTSDWLSAAIDQLIIIESTLPPYFFAGGLNSANLELVVSRLKPYCLDVSSSIEKQVGEKDIDAMKMFCNSARSASENCKTAKSGG